MAPSNLVRISFSIAQWSAWAPGLATHDAWLAWAKGTGAAPVGAEAPPLAEIPAMARRRVERLGRPAFQVAQWCQGEARDMPLIFASRHGDPGRTSELLKSLAQHEPLSPTSFALSVHNAAGAQYSIIRKDTANLSAIANGVFTVEAGVVEAAALWRDGHPEVLLVVYDASAHALYAPYYDEPDADFAFAWRLKPDGPFFLESGEFQHDEASALPHSLEVLRFMLRQDASLCRAQGSRKWKWSYRG